MTHQLVAIAPRVYHDVDPLAPPRAADRDLLPTAVDERRQVVALCVARRLWVAEEGIRLLPQVVRVALEPAEAEIARKEDEPLPRPRRRLGPLERFALECSLPKVWRLPRRDDEVLAALGRQKMGQ